MRTKTIVIGLALAIAGCGTTVNYTQTNTPPKAMQSKPAEEVEVFTSAKPERSFLEVGMIEAQQSSEFSTHDMGKIVAELRAEAGKRGCDGIIVTGGNDAVVGDVSQGEGYTTTLKGYRGACIVYKDESGNQ